ncbi:MAG: hypothetical protein M3022_05265 [Actinomycetota bacterium]|nr:hypothetical protein [Actinomycetota bacterium]
MPSLRTFLSGQAAVALACVPSIVTADGLPPVGVGPPEVGAGSPGSQPAVSSRRRAPGG